MYRWKACEENLLCTFAMYNLEKRPVRVETIRRERDFCFPAVIPRAVFLTKVMIPGFGGAYLFADNGGMGYLPDDIPRDFLYEAAKTRLREVRDYMENFRQSFGYRPKEPADRLRAAEELLAAQGETAPAGKALCEILKAGEAMVLLAAENKTAARGLRDNFCLGGCMKGFTDGGETWREAFVKPFGHGVIPLHWGCLEPVRGETHYDLVLAMLDWCKEHGITVRGHALVWFCCFWEGQSWMRDMTFPEVREHVVRRAEMLMRARPNGFDYVDINEPLQNNPYNFTLDQFFAICKDVYDVVKKWSPQTKIMVNLCNEWQEKCSFDPNKFEENVTARAAIGLPGFAPEMEYVWSVDDFLQKCREEGLVVDVLGLQMHDYPYELFGTMQLLEFWHQKWGLPIHLTEVSAPSSMEQTPYAMRRRPGPVTAYWHRPWDEWLQAQWYHDFVTLFYSLDYVECCVSWSLSDEPRQWADYLEGHVNEMFRLQAYCYDGLLDEENRPKPAYHTLCGLAEQWGLKTGRAHPDETG